MGFYEKALENGWVKPLPDGYCYNIFAQLDHENNHRWFVMMEKMVFPFFWKKDYRFIEAVGGVESIDAYGNTVITPSTEDFAEAAKRLDSPPEAAQ